ncbi:MAG: hypothetical protein WBA16_09680 [Nonlabens sp.]
MEISLKQISSWFLVVFWAVAGICHFVFPDIYIQVIPEWLGDAAILNTVAGITELLIAGLAVFNATRKWSGILAIITLTTFIVAHVYFIQLGSCISEFCIPQWIAWLRLILIHPLLIFWAYRVSKR